MILEGFKASKKLNTSGLAGWRVYATEDVYHFPNGVRRPKPNTWRLVAEQKIWVRGRNIIMPNIELEPTAEEGQPGIQLYILVNVDAEGRETWDSDSEFLFPASLGESVHLYDVMVFNLKLRGEWDESQERENPRAA